MIQAVRSLAEEDHRTRVRRERMGGQAMSARLRPDLIEAVGRGIARALEPSLEEADRG